MWRTKRAETITIRITRSRPLFPQSIITYYVNSTAYADFDFETPIFMNCRYGKCRRRSELRRHLILSDFRKGKCILRPPAGASGVGLQRFNHRGSGEVTSVPSSLLEKTISHGIKVSGLWCQDWCGKRVTSFGKRLQWDWQYHREMYPELPKRIVKLHEKGIKFLGYINPYLVNDGELYRRGKRKRRICYKGRRQ